MVSVIFSLVFERFLFRIHRSNNKKQQQKPIRFGSIFICILKIKTIHECRKIHSRLNRMDCYCLCLRACEYMCFYDRRSIHYLLPKIIRVLSRSSSHIKYISIYRRIRTILGQEKKSSFRLLL